MPRRRETRQRTAVREALDDVQKFVSAQQLHARLRAAGHGVGLATVYRALQHLAADGDVDVLRTPDGEATYRRCSSGHHHHLVCRACRLTVEVDSIAVERWTQRIAEENGFADVEHVVEVLGTCARCAASADFPVKEVARDRARADVLHSRGQDAPVTLLSQDPQIQPYDVDVPPV
jgi:Fur family ferric uptake transcriptional regulator